ncbi:MAG: glutamate--tRNA ligase, partial [Verrucomicrobiales bacterium]
ALLGWSAKDDQEIFSIEELKTRFDLPGVNSSNSKFDYDKCRWVNSEHLKHLSAADLLTNAAPFLSRAGIDPTDTRVPAALELARDRAQLLSEIPGVIATIFSDTVTYDDASIAKVREKEELPQVISALADGIAGTSEWTVDGIKSAITEAAGKIGLKMGALMLPCRVAVMGSTTGADLVPVLVLLGKEEVVKRLTGFGAML